MSDDIVYPNLGLWTRAGHPSRMIPYQTASQSAMGTIAQSASQSTMDTISSWPVSLHEVLPDQPVSYNGYHFLI